MHGTIKTPVPNLILSDRRNLTPGVFMICTEMSGNGARINFIAVILVPLLMGVHGKVDAALPEYFGAAAGTTSAPGTFDQRSATGIIPITAFSTSGSVS